MVSIIAAKLYASDPYVSVYLIYVQPRSAAWIQ